MNISFNLCPVLEQRLILACILHMPNSTYINSPKQDGRDRKYKLKIITESKLDIWLLQPYILINQNMLSKRNYMCYALNTRIRFDSPRKLHLQAIKHRIEFLMNVKLY